LAFSQKITPSPSISITNIWNERKGAIVAVSVLDYVRQGWGKGLVEPCQRLPTPPIHRDHQYPAHCVEDELQALHNLDQAVSREMGLPRPPVPRGLKAQPTQQQAEQEGLEAYSAEAVTPCASTIAEIKIICREPPVIMVPRTPEGYIDLPPKYLEYQITGFADCQAAIRARMEIQLIMAKELQLGTEWETFFPPQEDWTWLPQKNTMASRLTATQEIWFEDWVMAISIWVTAMDRKLHLGAARQAGKGIFQGGLIRKDKVRMMPGQVDRNTGNRAWTGMLQARSRVEGELDEESGYTGSENR